MMSHCTNQNINYKYRKSNTNPNTKVCPMSPVTVSEFHILRSSTFRLSFWPQRKTFCHQTFHEDNLSIERDKKLSKKHTKVRSNCGNKNTDATVEVWCIGKINNQVMMQRKGLIASRLHTQSRNIKKEENIIIFIKATRNLNRTRKSSGSGNFAGPQIPTKNTKCIIRASARSSIALTLTRTNS